MASIYKQPRSPYWWASFRVRTSTGWKQIRISTKITHTPPALTKEVRQLADQIGKKLSYPTKEQAMQKAQHLAEALEATARSDMTAYQLRKSINNIVSDLGSESINVPTVEEWLNDHLIRVSRNGLKPASILNYKQAFDKFKAVLGSRVNLPLDRITPLMLEEYRDYLTARIAGSTAAMAIRLTASAFQVAVDYKIIETNPFTALKRPRKERTVARRRKFEQHELSLVLSKASPEWQSMVKICLYTGGQRLGDVAVLRWDQVDQTQGVIRIETQKTGKLLIIPIIPALQEHLNHWRKISTGIYVHSECASIFAKAGTSRLSAQFGRILYQCGLIDKDPLAAGKQYKKMASNATANHRHINALSFHSLRYTATTLLHDAGVPPALVQAIVGHDSADVHAGYINFGTAEYEQALNKLPVI